MVLEGDFDALIKVSAWVTASMTYARFASSSTNPGNLRLLSLLPVVILLPCLPFYFTSINLRGTAAFFLAWLGVFKLLLLAFGLGPLPPSLPLPTFIAISSLPVKIQPNTDESCRHHRHLFVPSCIKLSALVALTLVYQYRSQVHPWLLLASYCLYIYVTLELIFALAAFLAGSLLGLGLEPQSDAPYKSTSLQEFWGRRWNLMVTSILRPSVYDPVRSRFGTTAGMMAVFLVSGLMHEVIFYYMTFDAPTGEVTLFFAIQGVCTAAEVKAKRAGWWRPHPAVGMLVTFGFVAATAFWLFFPPLLRGGADEKGIEECAEALRLMEAAFRRLIGNQWFAGSVAHFSINKAYPTT